MPPVHSLSAPGSRIRRSRVLPTTVSLFPECPDDHSPKPGIAGRLTGDREAVFVTCDRKTVDEPVASNPGGSSSGCPTADCPPPSSASPDSQNRATGWHCPPRSILTASADAKKIGGAAGVFRAAGEVDLEPVRFEARTVRMDDQSVPRLRVCVQILLCAVHARIHGTGRRGVREKDFCEEGRGAAAAGRGLKEIFLCVGTFGRDGGGTYRDRNGDRPVSTRGAGVWRNAGVSGGIGEARRVERFVDHQVEPDCARYRCAEAHRGKVGPGDRYYDYDSAAAIGALAGASSAPTGFAPGRGETSA